MTDRLTSQKRSWNMSRIRSRDTAPELAVRKVLYRIGYRYRLHSAIVPGKPDIVLTKFKSVIFVHGCFWHRHPGCKFAYTPKSREEFWTKKFEANVRRDEVVKKQLSESGWRNLIIWECETKSSDIIENLLRGFLGENG
ncbi:very short patch repair endonuclease [Pseudomonas lundensis]|uniref:Very short patch repair endonuclease n=1 Tax=Pseudomonas lundensis TaxID=86185 RepID=A0ABX4GHE5_9PSED|nr:DNA mismatch endonuclease Vsr [Pseudomonas lundensis]OZY25888.1 very short patch repair endonuclease [Pseudomonas lundensis]OZY51398.1 very short patch repair endonuclease [Pseudomonas lundensis]